MESLTSLDQIDQLNNNINPYGIVEYADFKEFLESLAQQTKQLSLFDSQSKIPSSSTNHHHFMHQGHQRANMHNLEGKQVSILPAAGTSPGATSASATDSWNVEDDPIYDNVLGSVSRDMNQNKQLPIAAKIMLDRLVNNLGDLINTPTCEEEQLNSLAEQILSDELLFMNAVFHKQGSRYIIKLIKKIKKTDYAFSLTQILAPWFYELTTHQTARNVVESCLNCFGTGPNEVLYEQAIRRVLELGTNELGCLSLKECIDTITGEQRTRLLNHVAYFADYLSRDSYGNYVVQHVLQLKDTEINQKILKSLKGKFIALSQKKGGSHVVERCLECCPVGTDTVVREILMSSLNAPYQLARHPTGNYVIQKALNRTKELCLADLFGALVKSLEPHKRELICFTGGKHVVNLIKDGSSLQQ